MANAEDLTRLKQGVSFWNAWRAQNPQHEVDLSWANLERANLAGIDLQRAQLSSANLVLTNLRGANLAGAIFGRSNLVGTILSGANLRGAKLGLACLVGADLTYADLTGCWIYGISAWDLKLDGAIQQDLSITLSGPKITVDNLEVGQLIYLLLYNENIRSVIETLTSKVVIILGRFTPERKAVLDALRGALRAYDRVSVVFDFDTPRQRDVTDTVKLLVQLARYVIVDLSDPNSAPYELGVISMLGLETTPIVPIIVSSQKPFPMLETVLKKKWSTDLVTYQDVNDLITNLDKKILAPAEAKVRELRG